MRTNLFLLCVLAMPVVWLDARAQDPAEVAYDLSVAERPLPTQEIIPARVGSWLITPIVDLIYRYDDNVFATSSNTQSDSIFILTPRVRLESDWNRHSVDLEFGGDFGYYNRFSSENYSDYYFINRNEIEILTGNRLTADLLYRHAHEPRSSSENVGDSKDPLTFDQYGANLGFKRDLGIFTLGLNSQIQRRTYANSKAIGGGTIDNSYRDRTETEYGVTFGYEPFDQATAYLLLGWRETNYDDSTLDGRPNRDDKGPIFRLGAKRIIADLWNFDLYLGYQPLQFADSTLDNVNGTAAVTFGAEILWNPTAVSSLTLTSQRGTWATTEDGASAVVSTFIALNGEHQLRDNLILSAGLSYNQSDYYGSARKDNDYGFAVGLEYYLRRFLSLRGDYRYSERDSNFAFNNYTRNIAEVGLRFRF